MSKRSDNISPAQHQANILNAQLSTGPKTEPGKAKSKMNAMRHGLTGQFYVMNEPDRLAYTSYEKQMLDEWKPVGIRESQLAVAIAQNNWRLNRARSLEFNLFGVSHDELAEEIDAPTPEVEAAVTGAKTWLNHHQAIANLTLYEHRIEAMITRSEKRLEALQSTRKALEEKALDDAELLLCKAAMKSEPLESSAIKVNGFVFSAAALVSGLDRKANLAEARFYKKMNWNSRVPCREAQFRPALSQLSVPKAA